MNKFKQTILSLCREMVEKQEDLTELTTTDAGTPGYSTPYAFSKNKKKKSSGSSSIANMMPGHAGCQKSCCSSK